VTVGKKKWLQIRQTSCLKGAVTPPSSKSQTIRALFLGLMAKGSSSLNNVLLADDSVDAMRVCQALGAKVSLLDQHVLCESQGLPFTIGTHSLYAGNSGLTAKFLLPLLGFRANSHVPIVLDCGEQMRARPIASLVTALCNLGLSIHYLDQVGFLPVSVVGSLQGGETFVSGDTSQYLSALLLALPCAPNASTISVSALCERPYLEMTLQWLDQQAIVYEHQRTISHDIFKIPGGQHYTSFHTLIPGDFSSASYLIAAAVLLPGCVVLSGLSMQDRQGDKQLVTLLQSMGADIQTTPSGFMAASL